MKSQIAESRRRLAKGLKVGENPIQVMAEPGENDDEDESRAPLMRSWELTGLDSSGLDLELDFPEPFAVS